MNGTELFLLYVMGYALYGAINIWEIELFLTENYSFSNEIEKNFWLVVSLLILFAFWLPMAMVEMAIFFRKPK